MGDVVTAGDIMAALAERYPAEEYALLPQVANATGGYANRFADALALSLWPSRGIRLHGFEIKVSRSDWRRELRNPAKAESIASRCHYWWIAAPAGIVPLEELPSTWGLLELRDGKLAATRQAALLEPEPISLPFLAGILRAAAKVKPGREEAEAARKQGYGEGFKEGERRAKSDADRAQQALAEVRANLAKFEAASGVSIDDYRGENIGRLFKKVAALEDGWDAPLRRISRMRQEAQAFLERTAEIEVPA